MPQWIKCLTEDAEFNSAKFAGVKYFDFLEKVLSSNIVMMDLICPQVEVGGFQSRFVHQRWSLILPIRDFSSTFSHTHKVGNNGITANFVFPHNYSFLYYLYI